ncbi:hypothetical protein V6N13_063982 [Hibiscus sabdariffa]|uniref:Uncharacterized protein n=2 Tax=Hibiscus sabdariffa TaxID=183260 RepID=A0ABR2R2C2_9ROSI
MELKMGNAFSFNKSSPWLLVSRVFCNRTSCQPIGAVARDYIGMVVACYARCVASVHHPKLVEVQAMIAAPVLS